MLIAFRVAGFLAIPPRTAPWAPFRGTRSLTQAPWDPTPDAEVMTLQTLAAEDPPFGERAGQVSRPAVWETRLSLSHTISWRAWPRWCQGRGKSGPFSRGVYTRQPVAGAGDESEEKTSAERHIATTWARRLKCVFAIDLQTCEACGCAARIIAAIEDPATIKKIARPSGLPIQGTKPRAGISCLRRTGPNYS